MKPGGKKTPGRSLLLVEDEPVLGRTLLRFLEKHEFQAVWCTAYAQAKQVLQTNRVDYLVTDWEVPGGSVTQCVRQAIRKNRRIKVVVITAHPGEAIAADCPWPVLQKPFALHELLATLTEL